MTSTYRLPAGLFIPAAMAGMVAAALRALERELRANGVRLPSQGVELRAAAEALASGVRTERLAEPEPDEWIAAELAAELLGLSVRLHQDAARSPSAEGRSDRAARPGRRGGGGRRPFSGRRGQPQDAKGRMIVLVQAHPVQMIAVGTQPRSFVDPDSAALVDAPETIVDFTGRLGGQSPVRELAEIEAEIEAAKSAAKAASDRASELEAVAGAWDLQRAVVELQRAQAFGAAEAARNGQTDSLRRMWSLESERDHVLERRRQRDERRREMQEMLAND